MTKPSSSSSSLQQQQLDEATRRSIRKNFPLGPVFCVGHDNPVTIHDNDSQLFASLWSVMAETMCVTIELSRTTKEAIATIVGERNACPVCIKAHTLCGVLSTMVVDTSSGGNGTSSSSEQKRAKEKQHEQALQYAEALLDDLNRVRRDTCGSSVPSTSRSSSVGSGSYTTGSKKSRKGRKNKTKDRYSHLSKTAKAEVALVALLYDHMNRVVSVVMGDELSTAMFSMPRTLAKAVEKPSTIRKVTRMLSPLISGSFKTKHQPGMTLEMFRGQPQTPQKALPPQLQGLFLAGPERALAVNRLVQWMETFESEVLIGQDIMNEDLVEFLEREVKAVHGSLHNPQEVLRWVENCVGDEISAELGELHSDKEEAKAITMVLLLSSFAPQTAYQSRHWYNLVDMLGQDKARLIVAWWSLKCTFADAQGLDCESLKLDTNTMVKLLSC